MDPGEAGGSTRVGAARDAMTWLSVERPSPTKAAGRTPPSARTHPAVSVVVGQGGATDIQGDGNVPLPQFGKERGKLTVLS